MKTRTYSHLSRLMTFEERFDYLKMPGEVGVATLGFDRYLGQSFYRSQEWKHIRNLVIARDNGCDLAIPDYEIHGEILVHHVNPVNINDLVHGEEWIINPEYLITTTKATHNAIHYGNRDNLYKKPVARVRGDTKLW
jgi:hypothetical protein